MMANQLRQNIVSIAKKKGWSLSKLERDAGLHKNFMGNFLHDKSKNPGIDSIIKIADALNVGVDELLGKSSGRKNYDLVVNKKDVIVDVLDYLLTNIKIKKNKPFELDKLFNAIYEMYNFSLKKNGFDKAFADWYTNDKLQS